jgi:hypothetical protein
MQQSTNEDRTRAEIARRVEASSVFAVAKELGLAREQIARLAGGLQVRQGTLALARERFAAMAQQNGPEAA